MLIEPVDLFLFILHSVCHYVFLGINSKYVIPNNFYNLLYFIKV